MNKRLLNQYKICDDYVIGYCTNGGEFIFDKEDYERVCEYTWRKQKKTVCTNLTRNNPISLGRFILGDVYEGRKVQFRNSNSCDCRKSNLYFQNEYIDKGDYYEVYCFDGQFFLIDKDDFEIINKFIWHVDKGGYVITKQGSKVYKLHRYVMDASNTDKPEIDHINRNKLGNRKSNLRFANRSGNCINKNLLPSNKSGKAGVYWSKSANKWAAQINKNDVRYYLGCFDNKEDAIVARIEAEKKYHEEFTPVF